MIIGNNSVSISDIFYWTKVFNQYNPKLIIVISPNLQRKSMIYFPKIFWYSQMLCISNIETNKMSKGKWFFKTIDNAEEFIGTDHYGNPYLYWPTLNIKLQKYTLEDFPLVVGSDTPDTGLLTYYTSTFLKYYEDVRDKNIGKNQSKNHIIEYVLITAYVSDYSDGYPLKISKVCFMLPVVDEFSQPDFLKKPFKAWVWILTLIFLIYFTIILRLTLIPDWFLSFFEGLACSLGSVQKGVNNKVIYIQLFCYGFIIWNLYNAKLSSYLTTSNLGKELKSPEEINNANITLWANFYSKRGINVSEYLREFYPNILEFEQKIFKKGKFNYLITTEEFYERLYKFDVSHGYLINDIKWNFIRRSQMLLKRKLFKFSQFCSEYSFIYPLDLYGCKLLLQDFIKFFTLNVVESGLDIAWEQFTYNDIHFKFYPDINSSPIQTLRLEYFEVAWWILTFGITLSSITFLFEILFKNLYK